MVAESMSTSLWRLGNARTGVANRTSVHAHTLPARNSLCHLSVHMQVLVSVSTTLMNKLSFPRSTFPFPVSLCFAPPLWMDMVNLLEEGLASEKGDVASPYVSVFNALTSTADPGERA